MMGSRSSLRLSGWMLIHVPRPNIEKYFAEPLCESSNARFALEKIEKDTCEDSKVIGQLSVAWKRGTVDVKEMCGKLFYLHADRRQVNDKDILVLEFSDEHCTNAGLGVVHSEISEFMGAFKFFVETEGSFISSIPSKITSVGSLSVVRYGLDQFGDLRQQ